MDFQVCQPQKTRVLCHLKISVMMCVVNLKDALKTSIMMCVVHVKLLLQNKRELLQVVIAFHTRRDRFEPIAPPKAIL